MRALTHRCTVLRLGRVAGRVDDPANTTSAAMAQLMCGHEIVPPARGPSTPGADVLTLDGISTSHHSGTVLRDVSLAVRAGEILGIAGVSGNGQRALAEVISGVRAPDAGRMTIAGQKVTRFSPREVQALGLGRIPEDRMTTGLVTSLPLADSMVLPRVGTAAFEQQGLLKPDAIRAFAEEQIKAYDIRCPGPMTRWRTVRRQSAEGTVGARARFRSEGVDRLAADARPRHRCRSFHPWKIPRHAGQGLRHHRHRRGSRHPARLCDRIAVMCEGRIVGTLDSADATIARLGLLMTGAEGHS